MPEAFTFLDRIDQLIDAPASLLTTARQMLNDTHRLTNASDPTKIPLADVRRHVTSVVLQAVNDRLCIPLEDDLQLWMNTFATEHEVMEGAAPTVDDYRQAFAGSDVARILPPEFSYWDDAQILTQEILAVPVKDPKPVLERLGVGPADLEALVIEARTPRAKPAAAVPEASKDLAAEIRKDDLARLAVVLEIGDPMNQEIISCVLAGDPGLLETAFMLAAFSDADEALLRRISADRTGVTTPEDNARDLAEVMRAVTLEGGDSNESATSSPLAARTDTTTAGAAQPAAPAATAAEPDKPRRARTPTVDPATLVHTDMTHATRAMVVALSENTAATEQEVADVLGVPKSQMIRIRKGAEVFTPANPENLRALLVKHKRQIDGALEAFDTASVGA